MLNIECENLEVQPAELERELEYGVRKGEWMYKAKTWMLHEESWMTKV